MAKSYPKLEALAAKGGWDWKAFLASLIAQYGPQLTAWVLAIIESLLVPKAQGAKCPSGDCTELVAHLDQIIANAVCDLNCALCAKSLCCDDNGQAKKG